MPNGFTAPKTDTEFQRQIETLAGQAQGSMQAIKDLVEADLQSPLTQRKVLTHLDKLHRHLITIQLKNHLRGNALTFNVGSKGKSNAQA
jgi:hypothetical protein